MKEKLIQIIINLFAMIFVVVMVFWLTGLVEHEALRWWATLATLALPVAITATLFLARERLRGFDHGLQSAQHSMEVFGRGLSSVVATVRHARETAPVTHDELLATPTRMQIVEPIQQPHHIIDL